MDSSKDDNSQQPQDFADFLRQAEVRSRDDGDILSFDELSQAFGEPSNGLCGNHPEEESGDPREDVENTCPEQAGAEDGTLSVEEDDADQQQAEEAIEDEDDTLAGEDDLVEVTPLTILEAILFVGNEDQRPLAAAEIARGLRGVDSAEIDSLVEQLNDVYEKEGRPYRIGFEGPGYRMILREEFSPLRDKFYGRIREARLSQTAVDTLAIIAYRQGATREEIDKVRDKSSSSILSQLVRRGLVRVERDPERRRVMHYYTTDRFLKLFSLEAIGDLPQSIDVDASM